MVKTKANKKPKQNKSSHVKKNGNQADISEFRAQLDVLGLKIIQVTADGNCFFRALADQLEGNEDEHVKYRKMVVEFIKKNREMFEPFIEDDVPFDEYCQSMGHDGTWAGHMELQAASLVTHSNICIHRKMSPRWYIRNFDDHGTQMIHLSYHDWEHYNSLRLKEDTCIGPTRPIIIKADADLSVKSHQAKAAITKANGGSTKTIIQAEPIKKVMIGTGCEDEEKIEEVLLQFGGNVNTAIELLIEEQGKEGFSDLNDRISCSADSSHGSLTDSHNEKSEQCNEKVLDNVSKYAQTCHKIGSVIDKTNLLNDEKKIPRNKGCPCGSKKKYKACCGTVAARSSAKFAVNQTVGYGKGQKDKKHGRRGGQSNVANSFGSDEGPLDMGALCI